MCAFMELFALKYIKLNSNYLRNKYEGGIIILKSIKIFVIMKYV